MAAKTPTRDTIFCAAIDIAAEADRDAYITQACGDDQALQAQVKKLVDAHFRAGSFLDEPAAASGATAAFASRTPEVPGSPASRERPGTVIGPYKLLQVIGEGGMGTVFMAEQTQPVQRKVALKVIKPGMDSHQVIVRFEAERQALALMDHPNIAKVLDAGTTDSGRPYFVMELVKGVPITKYCDEHRLTPQERLKLFIPVCQAVQHAHQKGIIHRDLKPSNVLMALYDDRPVPKVIDFGVAKATGQKLTEGTLFTEFGQVVGTLEYMSPEQAGLNQLDIDTRSDIYSLGVLLYELLTGTTPLEKKQVHEGVILEVLRLIREEEPPKPSTRLSTAEERPSVAANRGLEPKKLSGLVRGELDWVVMKCLEKDRNRRYETANGLVMDVQRYLHDDPVAACPPSAWYRFRKLTRRHKTGLTAATLISLALVAGTAISLWQAIRATEAATSEGQALTNLGEEQQATKRELGRTQEAEKNAKLELFESLVAQARANRLSRRIGQRFATLKILEQAGALARQLKLPPQRFLEMRNEAIAALALPDVRVAKEWPDPPAFTRSFDAELARYARTDRQGRVEVRRVGDGKEIYRLADLPAGDNYPLLSPDGGYLAVFEPGRSWLHVWKLAGDEPSRVLDKPALSAFGFSPNSRRLALQHADGAIGIFDLATRTEVKRLPPVPPVSQMKFQPAGDRLALVTPGRFAQVLDQETGKVLWQKNLKDRWPKIVWHPDGKILAVADGEVISLWDVAQDKQVGKLENLGEGIDFTFDPSGTLLASNSWAWTLCLWDPLSNRQLFSTPFAGTTLQFSADGRFLADTQHRTNLCLWEIAAGHEYRTLVAGPLQGKRGYRSVAISPDGRFLAAGAEGAGGVGLWDLPSGKELAFLKASPGINYVALEPRSPDAPGEEKKEGTLLTMSGDGLFRRPIRAEPQIGVIRVGPAQRLPVQGISDGQIAQSRDGRVLAAAQFQGAVVIHADQPDQPIKLGPQDDVRYIAVSPDGQWVATGSFGTPGGAKVWQLGPPGTRSKTAKLVKDLPGGTFCRPVFSPDGKRLILGGYDEATATRLIRCWEVETWVERSFTVPLEGLNPAFSPDGKLLVVETGSGVARLLDADTGREYARLEDSDQHRTNNYAFTPDGTKLACATGEGSCVHIWDLQAIRRQLAEMELNWESPPKTK